MIPDIEKAMSWLKDNNCHVVVIESTGKYWIPVFNLMEEHFSLTLANPHFTKTFPGNKTDRRDAKWLAELHRLGLVRASFIPPKAIRELRDLTRYRFKLVKTRTSEKSRIHNILTVCNIMLSSVATDIFGKSGMNIIHALFEGGEMDEETLSKMVYGKLKGKLQDLIPALKGQLTESQSNKLKIALDNYEGFNEKIEKIDLLIRKKAEPYKHEINRLCTCFAIKNVSAIGILAEIGTDMTMFPSSNHLCSWAGLCPENNETGGKRKSARTKKGNLYLKSILTQCVNAMSRSKSSNSHFVARLYSLKMRRGHSKAVIAVCRSMLVSIYNMLSNDENYKDYTPRPAIKQKPVSCKGFSDVDLILELNKRGYKLEIAT